MTINETKEYLESIEEVLTQLLIDRQIFLDFHNALINQKAKNNPFIQWCLRNYFKAIVLNLCKILEPAKNDPRKHTLRHFINSWKGATDRARLEEHLKRATITFTDIDTGEMHEESIADSMLAQLREIDFDADLEKVESMHNKLKDYRNTQLCHNDCSKPDSTNQDVPAIAEINDFISEIESIIGKYFHIFCREGYVYDALKTPQIYRNFNLHLD